MKKVKTPYGYLNLVKSQKRVHQKQKLFWDGRLLGPTCRRKVRKNIRLGLVGLLVEKGGIKGESLMLRMFEVDLRDWKWKCRDRSGAQFGMQKSLQSTSRLFGFF
jgi:hypothetical protein